MTDILIGVSSFGGSMRNHCGISLCRLTGALFKAGIRNKIECIDHARIAEATDEDVLNEFATRALNSDLSHLLLVENDMSFEPPAVGALLATDKLLIGCAHSPTSANSALLADHLEAETGTGVIKVVNLWNGLRLIKVSAFRQMVKTGAISSRKSLISGDQVYGFFDVVAGSDDEAFCVRVRELLHEQVYALV